MKNMTSLIPAALMFIILAVLFIFMCLPTGQISGYAEKGILDLRGSQATGVLYSLRGDWQFAFGELLKPGEQPGRYGTIEVPSSWHTAGYPLGGAATYRLVIQTDENKMFALYVSDIPSTHAIWINGEFKREAGVVSAEAGRSRVLYQNAIIPMQAQDGVIEIVIQVSNHFSYGSGLANPLMFGDFDTVMLWFARTRALYSIGLGCILMMAFYHFVLFIFRRREKVYLLFSLLCALCFMRFFLDTNGINRFVQWLPMNEAAIRFNMTLFFMHSAAIILFTLFIFSKPFTALQKKLAAGYVIVGLLFFILVPMNSTAIIPTIMLLVTPFLIFAVIVAARSPVFRNTPLAWLYLIALLLYLFVGTFGLLIMSGEWFMTGIVTNMFMIMSQSLVLSRRYTDAFKFVEETNTNLEQIVDERTKNLQAANEAMLVTNNAMKELVTNISHDLKTPLHVMSINLETLSELTTTQNDAAYQRHVRVAYQKNLDLQRLIRNLFEVSRIETDRNIYTVGWVSILDLLAQVKEKYDTYMEDHGITFEVNVGDDFEISADPQKIWSVFDNIIFNAVRHTVSGGCITMTANNTESSATVTVTDTGCGIDPKHLPRIFERFYKASQERSANDGESGLGLYIVKCIMEGCGGNVRAESEIGKGTSIILTFSAKPVS